MVAEFIARQSGSPINGETACLNSGSAMPASHTMAHHNGHDSHLPMPPLGHHHSGPITIHHPQPQHLHQQQHHQQQQQQQHQHQQQQQQQHHHQQQQQQHHQQQPMNPENYPNGSNSNGSSSSGGGGNRDYASEQLRKELFSQRKQREFIPDNKKDDSYWDRRRRNNEAAKRSREKRRFNDMVLEQRVMELSKENHILKAQLDAIHEKYGICVESVISAEQVLASMPSEPTIVKRAKLQSTSSALLYARTPSPSSSSISSHHTSVIHQPVSSGGGTSNGAGARSPRSPGALYVPETTAYPETESFQYPPFTHPAIHSPFDTSSALNLSRGRRAQSPFELSSGSGDESVQMASSPTTALIVSAAVVASTAANGNSLPHKLRHKSRNNVQEKDASAASALLALQGIKQEPGPRASPPWDNEGSSDERDSGISLGAEWTTTTSGAGSASVTTPESEREVKSRLDRLASEVASLQSILRLGKTGVAVSAAGNASADGASVVVVGGTSQVAP